MQRIQYLEKDGNDVSQCSRLTTSLFALQVLAFVNSKTISEYACRCIGQRRLLGLYVTIGLLPSFLPYGAVYILRRLSYPIKPYWSQNKSYNTVSSRITISHFFIPDHTIACHIIISYAIANPIIYTHAYTLSFLHT